MGHPDSTLITGIGELVTNDGDDGGYAARTDAALVISAGDDIDMVISGLTPTSDEIEAAMFAETPDDTKGNTP